MPNFRFLSLRLLPLLMLAACATGPDYQHARIELPEQFTEAGSDWRQAHPSEPRADWWKAFDDVELDRMQARLLIDNQNLKVAEAQYRAAHAALGSAKSAELPSVGASAGISRSRSSAGIANNFNINASASWEIDLWGRLRRSVEAASALSQASADDLAAARLSYQALLAQTWFQLLASNQQVKLLQATQDADSRFLDLTRTRHQAGVASGLDVAQAESQLASVRSQLSENALARAQLVHALASLLGKAGIDTPAITLPLARVPTTPILLPSGLLESRPDIAAAERRAAAANANIGLAKTAYFPAFDLAANVGQGSKTLSSLFAAGSRVWSLGPSLAMTLFDGGARSAGVEQARANYDQAIASYRQSVLTAFQEVEDNLAAARLLEEESGHQSETLAAARKARMIAEEQYRAGTVDALNVINAQTAEYGAESTLISLHGRRLTAAAQLLKNTAGKIPVEQ